MDFFSQMHPIRLPEEPEPVNDQERQRVKNLGHSPHTTEIKSIAKHLAGELTKYAMDLPSDIDGEQARIWKMITALGEFTRGLK